MSTSDHHAAVVNTAYVATNDATTEMSGLTHSTNKGSISTRKRVSEFGDSDTEESDEEDEVCGDNSTGSADEFEEIASAMEDPILDKILQAVKEEDGVSLSMKKLDVDTKLPSIPENFVSTAPRIQAGEPRFSEVDNPGGWSDFVFRAKFAKGEAKYLHHVLPSDVIPVPTNQQTGFREEGQW